MFFGCLDGSRVWGRVDTCVCMVESLCCPPEFITTLLISSIQYKKFFFFFNSVVCVCFFFFFKWLFLVCSWRTERTVDVEKCEQSPSNRP